jgi:uncharacterized protein (DUF1015 family)
MQILAFTGLRYTDKAGSTLELAAPPFDQIGPELRDRLQASSPHHFAHLTRALPGPENDPHEHARSIHERWLKQGSITADEKPSLYSYRIVRAGGTERFGILGLVGVGPSAEGDLRPHELTVDKPLADRLALLETTRVDLEPVMYIAEDDGSLEKMFEADCTGEVLAEHLDGFGDRHFLYAVTDPSRINQYKQAFAPCRAVIADGHHRTKVAQLFARKHEPPEGTASCAKMAVIFSVASSDLQIDPIHRAVQAAVDLDAIASTAAHREVFTGTSGHDFAAAVAAASQPAIGVWAKGHDRPELWQIDTAGTPPGTPGNDTNLSTVLLHYQVLAASGLTIENSTDGSIHYKSDPDELWQLAQIAKDGQGDYELLVWLPGMEPADFAKATEKGDVLPPKSTRFLPKLISGLVWSSHHGKVL